jgi:hypothetical protein
MTAKKIEKLLEQTWIHGSEMQYGLYEYELGELLDELKASLAKDKDDYIFAVTENSGHVAMVLIEKSGQVHINEQAREKLKALWPAAYESNMKKLIPAFAKQLNEGEMPINGVKTVGIVLTTPRLTSVAPEPPHPSASITSNVTAAAR